MATYVAGSRSRRAAFVALLKGEEILTVVEHNGQIGFPGGRVKPSETWEKALSREFLEEVRACLPLKRYNHIGWSTPYYEIRVFIAQIEDSEAETIHRQSKQAGKLTDVHSWAWVPRASLPSMRLRPHIQAALAMLNAIDASAVGQEGEWRSAHRRSTQKKGAATIVPSGRREDEKAEVPHMSAPKAAPETVASTVAHANAITEGGSSLQNVNQEEALIPQRGIRSIRPCDATRAFEALAAGSDTSQICCKSWRSCTDPSCVLHRQMSSLR